MFALLLEHTGEEWHVIEGYRSAERQLWLYEQGRTRQGRIVTWMKEPKYHGKGLAADIAPSRHGYNAPEEWWSMKQHLASGLGLTDPAFEKGDKGHVQMDGMQTEAASWVSRGFKDG